MKILVSFLLGIAVGCAIVKFFTSPNRELSGDHLIWANEGIHHISSESNSIKQIEEAEKYYGKAVVLFLASLYNQKSQASLVKNEEIAPHIYNQNKLEFSDKKLESSEEINSSLSMKPENKKENTQKSASTKEKEIDRMVAFRKSPLLSNMTPEVRKLNGIFHGTFIHKNGKHKGRVDQVDMDFFLEMQKGKLRGLIKIQLTNPDGHLYSNSTNEGQNNTLRLIKDKPNKIYIEPAPGDFIIIDISNVKRMTGEYYDSDGSYKGIVQVQKI